MAIVIPRAFSSGALSIESNARYFTLGFAFDSTLVIAAVSVVFPWSMCPIVPTFMCGLDRSNFSLAIAPHIVMSFFQFPAPESKGAILSGYGSPLNSGYHLVLNISGRLFIPQEVHRIRRPPLRAGPQLGGVAEHFRQRHLGSDDLR